MVGLAEGIETGAQRHAGVPRAAGLGGARRRAIWSRSSLPPEITRVVLLADHDGEGVGLKVAERAAASVPCRRAAGLDRPSTRRRRRLQRSAAEAGRRRGPPGGRGRGRMAARRRSREHAASTAEPELGTHRPLGFRAPDVAASPDARRRWRPRPAHRSLLEPAVRLQRAALALPLRRRAVLGRAGQRWAARCRGP